LHIGAWLKGLKPVGLNPGLKTRLRENPEQLHFRLIGEQKCSLKSAVIVFPKDSHTISRIAMAHRNRFSKFNGDALIHRWRRLSLSGRDLIRVSPESVIRMTAIRGAYLRIPVPAGLNGQK
jgi:hypothetical protein